jgi:hypothetical protein
MVFVCSIHSGTAVDRVEAAALESIREQLRGIFT